jgi:hypothetical protein
MNNKYLAYYLFLALFTFGVALHTVFIGSNHVDYGKRVSHLEQQKQQLVAKAQHIEQHTSQSLSMATLNNDAEQLGFVPIQQIVRVDTSTVVASR